MEEWTYWQVCHPKKNKCDIFVTSNEKQIIAILKQGEAELTTAGLCRQRGMTKQTYPWKAKYGGNGDAKKMKQLEEDNLSQATVCTGSPSPISSSSSLRTGACVLATSM